jgi:hypothetical protein
MGGFGGFSPDPSKSNKSSTYNTFIKTSNKLENFIYHNYLITSLKIKSIQRN